MAAIHCPRSRSPVISIRTQAKEQNTLRAEIEAATRTQHEIVPRNSRPSAFSRRDKDKSFRQTQLPVTQQDMLKCQNIPGSGVANKHKVQPDTSDLASHAGFPQSTVKRSQRARNPWKQFTRHIVRAKCTNPVSDDHTTVLQNQCRLESSRGGNARPPGQATDAFPEQDISIQDTQLHSWLEKRFQEQNLVDDLQPSPMSKTKRTVRRSLYGSLTTTKNFFCGQTKSSPDRTRAHSGFTAPRMPHTDDAGMKDNQYEQSAYVSAIAPLSPFEAPYRICNAAVNVESLAAVELSAGPVPAELEGNIPNDPVSTSNAMSRVSTPSIRDLPPYVNEKDFRDDIVKDHEVGVNSVTTDVTSRSANVEEKSYRCTSCDNVIVGHEVYDFCSICDSADRVLCTRCAARGPCCHHELEHRLRTRATARLSSASSQDPADLFVKRGHSLKQPTWSTLSDSLQGASCAPPLRSLSSPGQFPKQNTAGNLSNPVAEEHDDQVEFLKEIGYLRREQELNSRERELAIRNREIDLKDQRTNLREREAIIQQKSDMLMRNLESLVSYQEIAKSAFIGAQFQSQKVVDAKGFGVKDLDILKDQPSQPIAPEKCAHLRNYRVNVAQVVAEVDATLRGAPDYRSRPKSQAAQKRKKDGAADSGNSTPSAPPSPQQLRKPLSGGSSDRDGSQDDDDAEDSRRSAKKHKHEPMTPSGPQLLFACPYAKNNPVRFSSRNTTEKNYRGCGTHYLPDVSRLKQHLRRVHWQPDTYCPRCFEEFANSTKLAEHARASIACKARDCPFPEKMDKTQQEKIHVKRPRVRPEKVWYDIYRVLFPGEALPESPYMEADDRVITPLSATPQSDVNSHATHMFSNHFRNRLDRHEDLQQGPLRDFIEQALDDSFRDFLNVYTLSPTASPGAGPSIVVSPVSRSSSDTTRPLGGPAPGSLKSPKLERKHSVTNVISQPRQVPLLQHPRPPRPRVNTALEVPTDHHRSPSRISRRGSQASDGHIDSLPSFNVMSHIRDDQGYGDDCQSYEQGDDLQAMALFGEPAAPAARKITDSVISNDSGYGSLRKRQHFPTETDDPTSVTHGFYDDLMATRHSAPGASPGKFPRVQPFSQPNTTDITTNTVGCSPEEWAEHNTNDFESYSDILGPSFQEEMYTGTNSLLFYNQHNAWPPS